MKNNLIKTLGVTAALAALATTLNATPLTGAIGFTGQVQLDTPTAGSATEVVNWFNTTVNGDSGSFAGIGTGTAVTFASPWFFATPNATYPSGMNPFWTIVVGATTYTFNLATSAIISQSPGFVLVRGTGTVSDGNPADNNALDWSFTTQDPSIGSPNKFTFSASSSSIPDGGTTVMLLGAALSGIALLKRKLAA